MARAKGIELVYETHTCALTGINYRYILHQSWEVDKIYVNAIRLRGKTDAPFSVVVLGGKNSCFATPLFSDAQINGTDHVVVCAGYYSIETCQVHVEICMDVL